jgi:hypothetical protein
LASDDDGAAGRNPPQGIPVPSAHGLFVSQEQEGFMAKYGLLWLIGVPLPILLILYFVFH